MPKAPKPGAGPDHETNDRLTVYKADWDIVEDDNVYFELGMLVSPDNGWTVSDPQIVGELRYGDPEYGPYSIGYEYAAVSEKNDPGNDDVWVNRRAESWYRAASGGHLNIQRKKTFAARSADIALIITAIVFFVVFVIAPFAVDPQLEPAANHDTATTPIQYYNAEGTPVAPPTPTAIPHYTPPPGGR